MKVVLINHFPLMGSGSGVYTLNLAKYLKQKGNEVVVIVPENEKCIHGEYDFEVVPVRFNTEELPFNFPCFTTHPYSENTFYNLTSEEYNQYCLAFDKILKDVVANFNPDIIHCGHIWTLSRLASFYGIPLVITAHGTDLIGFNNCVNEPNAYIDDALEAYNKASKIITISKDNLKLVENIFGVNDKNIMMPNGYDKEMFHINKTDRKEFLTDLGIAKNYKNVISFVGKFTEIKRIDVLIKAYAEIQNDDTLLLLAGDGELFDEMNKLAYSSNISNIRFLRNRPQNFLCNLFNISDVSVVPSKDEAFGLVVIESLACGTPVIGANSGGIPDIINDQNGLLFEVDNVEDLKDKLEYFLSNKEKYDRASISKGVLDKYSQDNFINYLIYNYESILKTRKK